MGRRVGTKQRRPLACYHEAGHCLARWYFGREFDRAVVLSPDELRRSVGITGRCGRPVADAEGFMDGYDVLPPYMTPALLAATQGDPKNIARLQALTWAAVGIDLAELYTGPAAEARYRKCSLVAVFLTGGQGDWERIKAVADTWYPDPRDQRDALLLAEKRASALVRSAAGWQAIIGIAERLAAHGEISWEIASPLMESCYGWLWIFRGGQMEGWPPPIRVIRAGTMPAAHDRLASPLATA